MSKYFSLAELTRSSAALRLGIDNTPPEAVAARLELLAARLLDPVRELWGAPLIVNSGYRCAELNRAVGGAARSQHMEGEAADITTGSREGNRRLFVAIVECAAGDMGGSGSMDGMGNMGDMGAIEFDQLIDEHGYSWLHLSYREGGNRHQILHL